MQKRQVTSLYADGVTAVLIAILQAYYSTASTTQRQLTDICMAKSAYKPQLGQLLTIHKSNGLLF